MYHQLSLFGRLATFCPIFLDNGGPNQELLDQQRNLSTGVDRLLRTNVAPQRASCQQILCEMPSLEVIVRRFMAFNAINNGLIKFRVPLIDFSGNTIR